MAPHAAHDNDAADTDTDGAEDLAAHLYDAPPAPPGVSADIKYLAKVHAHGTRAIIRELRNEREDDDGVSNWLARQLGKLHPTVQASLAMGAVYLVLQLGGAVYEHLTGHAPPQPTQPVTEMTSPAPHPG